MDTSEQTILDETPKREARRHNEKTYRCPCCKFKTLHGRAAFELCPVCWWEDDGQKDEQLLSRDAEIEHLKLLIAKLRRMQFGSSSEKVGRQIEQLELRLVELEESRTKESLEREGSAAERTVARPARRPLPEHLRREVQTYLPKEEACPDCGGKLKRLGEDASEILEYVRERIKGMRQRNAPGTREASVMKWGNERETHAWESSAATEPSRSGATGRRI